MHVIIVAAARSADWIRRSAGVPTAIFIAGMIAVPVLIVPGVIALSGIRDYQALARASERAEATRWDVAFCKKYGMAQESVRHKACLNDLLDLRRQERQRLDAEAGIL